MIGRGYAKGRARRAEILEAAIAVFGEVGYRGATLREIAARAGISHPGLLHHFPTKQALLLAVLTQRDEADSALVAPAGSTGTEQLHRIVELVAVNATRPGIIEMFTVLSAEATSPEHPAHAHLVARYQRTVANLTQAYTSARDEGALRPGVDPADAARTLVALMDGLQVQWLLDPQHTNMADLVAAHLSSQLTTQS